MGRWCFRATVCRKGLRVAGEAVKGGWRREASGPRRSSVLSAPLCCMFSMPAGSEWLIILVIVLIFFGAGRLPDVLKQMGKGVRAFKDASSGEEEDSEKPRKVKKKATPQLSGEDDLDEEEAEEKSKTKERVR